MLNCRQAQGSWGLCTEAHEAMFSTVTHTAACKVPVNVGSVQHSSTHSIRQALQWSAPMLCTDLLPKWYQPKES